MSVQIRRICLLLSLYSWFTLHAPGWEVTPRALFPTLSGVMLDSMRRLTEKIILYCAALAFVRSAIEEGANLDAFREKPTLTVLAGVFAIVISFPLGWPAVAALGLLSIKMQTPWIVVIGGPLIYGFSHLVFLFGMYLSGAVYSLIFCRWLTRVIMERALSWTASSQPIDPAR